MLKTSTCKSWCMVASWLLLVCFLGTYFFFEHNRSFRGMITAILKTEIGAIHNIFSEICAMFYGPKVFVFHFLMIKLCFGVLESRQSYTVTAGEVRNIC